MRVHCKLPKARAGPVFIVHASVWPTVKDNRLLAALPEAACNRLLPDLEPIALPIGETLISPATRVRFAYFPTDSIVTVAYAVEESGAMAKAWPVGCEGMVGISLFLGGSKPNERADVQVGGRAFRIPAAALLAEFQRAGAVQHLLLRYVFALVTQASQIAVCINYHDTDKRLCRFLMRLFDRLPGGDVAMTHERIGELLGIRRSTISQIALQLHSEGIIDYRRGRIQLISRAKLEQRTCACGEIIRRAFDEVFE